MAITNLFVETTSYKRQLVVEMFLVTPSSSICADLDRFISGRK